MKKGQLPVESVSLLLPALLTLLSTFPQTVCSFSEKKDKQQTRTSSACYLQRALTGFAPGTVYPHSWQETLLQPQKHSGRKNSICISPGIYVLRRWCFTVAHGSNYLI